MQSTPSLSRAIAILFAGALMPLCACQTTQPTSSAKAADKVEIANEYAAAADVVSVQKAERTIVVRREDGTLLSIVAPEEVRNFDQIAPGDKLRVRFKQELSITRATADEAAAESGRDAQVAAAAARAPKGGRPAAGVAMALNLIVKIESIDLPHDIVVFSLASGELRAHRIATPDGREFAKGLKVGEQVRLVYKEALALGVERL